MAKSAVVFVQLISTFKFLRDVRSIEEVGRLPKMMTIAASALGIIGLGENLESKIIIGKSMRIITAIYITLFVIYIAFWVRF